ncbi:DUF3303 family protein [Streptomyces specialis]|uniref:DUF3303 family protein n=1 Tax=Streptomyces specialis TaxID=498367 RepID=UPI00073E6E83|nr:DUF3303 family protein [Streptomyces specialis]
MRTMLIAEFDTDKANEAIRDQTMARVMGGTLEKLKPEAAFFGSKDGARTGFLVFDLDEPARIPEVCEPLFQELGAKITMLPVMTFDDVKAGLQRYAAG